MDPEIRKKIMEKMLVARQEKVTTSQPSIAIEKKVFEHRKELAKIKAYAKKIKIDDDDWGDSEWEGFEKWIGESKSSSITDILSEVMVNKTVKESEESDEKSELRKKIIENITTTKMRFF